MTSPTMDLVGNSLIPYALIGSATREIGTIFPDIVTREIHDDETVITQHPVETGSPISDHAYIQPPRVEMDCRFSNSTAQSEGYVQTVYQEFLALQAELTPFNVTTGKRQYTNMLIETMHVTTDEFTEWVLAINVLLKQVNIVGGNSGTSTPPMQNSDSDEQSDSDQTAASQTSGMQSIAASSAVPTFAQASSSTFNAVNPFGD